MKKLLMILTIVCTCGVVQDALALEGLRLILRLEHDKFLESQAIWVHVALINTSATKQEVQPYALSDDMSRGVRFKLIDEKGMSVPQGLESIHDDFGTAKPRVLAPGDSITEMFNIRVWFSTSGIRNAAPYLATMHYLKAGSYILQARQHIGKDTLFSNLASFTVQRPTGKELEVLQRLREAERRYAEDLRIDAAVDAYERILERFPRTAYGPYVYYRLIRLYRFRPQQDRHKAFDLLAKLAESYPNDCQTLYIVSVLTPTMLKEGRKDVLEKLARDIPRTRVGQLSIIKLQEVGQRK